eukprot:1648497-Prymnesium_polylepis.1
MRRASSLKRCFSSACSASSGNHPLASSRSGEGRSPSSWASATGPLRRTASGSEHSKHARTASSRMCMRILASGSGEPPARARGATHAGLRVAVVCGLRHSAFCSGARMR